MTQSLEDYLEAIGILDDEGPVRVTDIASRLGVSKPSAHAALHALENQGFLTRERYGTAVLTESGRRQAAHIRERHETLAAFLRDVVGVGAETAERDACRMEHLLSAETLDRIRGMVERARHGGDPA